MPRRAVHPISPSEKLFTLLYALDLDQRTLGTHLGVSKGLVSRWASGHKPISAHHDDAIQALLVSALDAAIDRKQRTDPEGVPAYRQEILQQFRDYLRERYAVSGDLIQDMYTRLGSLCQIMGPPGETARHTYSAAELDALEHAATQLITNIRVLRRLEPLTAREPDTRRCVNE